MFLSSIRNWFLDLVVEVNDARILKFLENRFRTRDISASEAVQMLLLAMNHLQPIPELAGMAQVSLCAVGRAYLGKLIFNGTVCLSPPDLLHAALQQIQRLSVANRDAHLRLSGVQKLCLFHTLSNLRH